MKQLKRSECAILPLVLKGKWYDMIASGEKREEFDSFTKEIQESDPEYNKTYGAYGGIDVDEGNVCDLWECSNGYK
jgi:hypothetical protein